jgi:hypothetical protein
MRGYPHGKGFDLLIPARRATDAAFGSAGAIIMETILSVEPRDPLMSAQVTFPCTLFA